MQQAPRNTIEKIRDSHRVLNDDGSDLLYVDRHYLHEGSHHAFARMREAGRQLRHPELTFGVADHYAPSSSTRATDVTGTMISRLRRNAADFGIDSFDIGDPRRGIVHVAMPEQGLTLPGMTIVCGDSHTATHGAFGAFAFGIGASEVAHVMATQCLWQKPTPVMRIDVTGQLQQGTTAKDLALAIIGRIGTGGATGHAVEYGGSAITALSMEERMTLCNMTIEMGARSGLVPPDEVTFDWLKGRPLAPSGPAWDSALSHWRTLTPDEGARYDRRFEMQAAEVAPMVTWGTSPEHVAPVNGRVPEDADPDALGYMGLIAGMPVEGLGVDRAFIGSCTNGRLRDLQAAANVLKGRRVAVPLLVSPGSDAVARAAEDSGIADIFRNAGAEWGASGCSLCVGMNGDQVAPGERCASTSNRNFRGRQGPGARTHLMSPEMVAAAAVTGRITDARTLLQEELPA
ncbi:3-isopropylmalate dehydratase large subunit [Pseudooceanicola sediminis]|uniref:3-isopropylmalate dehydratase n=1 Tax=Pseudooceanicola sediminis TaxID=2211117 RepID=A0A399IWU9_9RHOB|nr:3-isopropylmalate dehydratase large subunit [Pseudooceanicola sediminis]KAA2312977.1 3-isopropylmalate dehydratase large subunit [Puniceibacterium sp. HSS470]RII37623.1 3-isopropylmalate dehydratase large subunit [Pseudooceanicola sediminis]|tara:strand:- start:27572 stop:28948 length:1377 start_codon:yes stop_codon:yes gene_type:complete